MTVLLPFNVRLEGLQKSIYRDTLAMLRMIGVDTGNNELRRFIAEAIFVITTSEKKYQKQRVANAAAYLALKRYAPWKLKNFFKLPGIRIRKIWDILLDTGLSAIAKPRENNIVTKIIVDALEKLGHIELLNTCIIIYKNTKEHVMGKKPSCYAGAIIDIARILHGSSLTQEQICRTVECMGGLRKIRYEIEKLLNIKTEQTPYYMVTKVIIPSRLARQLNINNPILAVEQ